MLEILLATAILAGDAPVDRADLAVMRPAILAVAESAEIMDHREAGYMLGVDPSGDLETLRGRWNQFAAAPPIIDHLMFPDRTFVNEALALNRQWRAGLTTRLADDLQHADEIRSFIGELDRRYEIWDAVRDSSCTYYYVTVRRQALALLRERIGDEAYYSGHLPGVLP